MTRVINLLGGSGIGKSTTAAGLYYAMKLRGYHVELVREYVKNWMWEERRIGEYDQFYIASQQAKAEYTLYGKVDWVITDSPMLLAPIYEEHYSPPGTIRQSVINLMKKAEVNGVEHINIMLKRNKKFDKRGRRETLKEAKMIDKSVLKFLKEEEIPYDEITCKDDERVLKILDLLEKRYNLPRRVNFWRKLWHGFSLKD